MARCTFVSMNLNGADSKSNVQRDASLEILLILQIRSLAGQDIDAMEELHTLFANIFEEEHTYCGNRPDNVYLHELINSKYFMALAALHGATAK